METGARARLARDLAGHLAARHGDAILVGGVFGSAARGDDTLYSDLDMLFVARDGAGVEGRSLLFKHMVVSIKVVAEGALEAELGGPGAEWPFWMGVLAELRPLAGDPAHLERWRALGMALDGPAFLARAARHLPGLVFESYGRIRSCAARGNERDATPAALEVVYELMQALCLLNRRWVTRDYYAGLEQSFAFPLRPAGYEELAPRLLAARELPEIVTVAGQLVAAYWQLLAANEMTVQNYQRVEDLPL